MAQFILDDADEPVEEPDLLYWARWMETAKRHVAKDEIGDVSVSTVFLGIDHSFRNGPPILYETMIFGGSHDHIPRAVRKQDCSLGYARPSRSISP